MFINRKSNVSYLKCVAFFSFIRLNNSHISSKVTGVTPAATSSDKPYKLFLKYKDKQQTMIGGLEFYQGNKPVITLKELDFRVRQTLIKNKKLYNGEFNKGQIRITGGGNHYTIDLSKKLKLTDTNRYVKNPRHAEIEVILEKSH
ncbi:exotoxin [Staphylococcus aureus]|nr:exotoxin [Staphylococcus aureus]